MKFDRPVRRRTGDHRRAGEADRGDAAGSIRYGTGSDASSSRSSRNRASPLRASDQRRFLGVIDRPVAVEQLDRGDAQARVLASCPGEGDGAVVSEARRQTRDVSSFQRQVCAPWWRSTWSSCSAPEPATVTNSRPYAVRPGGAARVGRPAAIAAVGGSQRDRCAAEPDPEAAGGDLARRAVARARDDRESSAASAELVLDEGGACERPAARPRGCAAESGHATRIAALPPSKGPRQRARREAGGHAAPARSECLAADNRVRDPLCSRAPCALDLLFG